MTGRRFIRTMLLIGLLAVFVFLWMSDPSEVAQPPVPTATMAVSRTEDQPAAKEESAFIKVALAVDPEELSSFEEINKRFHLQHPAFGAELVRLEPEDTPADGDVYGDVLRMADVLLLPGEAVLSFAVNGLILPVDDLLVGDATAQPFFEAVMSGVRWNGLVWGVPYDMDPYVLLWNLEVLGELAQALADSGAEDLGARGADGAFPPADGGQAVRIGWEAWKKLPEALEGMENGDLAPDREENGKYLLALDPAEPGAWLAWFGTATGLRADLPLGAADEAEEVREALEWLGNWGGRVLAAPGGDVLAAVRDGRAAAAAVPHSAALRAVEESGSGLLAVDRSGWNAPFAWSRVRSLVILSGTGNEEAARAWVAAATDPEQQRRHHARTGKLPVSRALLQTALPAHSALGQASAGAFPHAPSPEFGPQLPERLRQLAEGWGKIAAGQWSAEDWFGLTR